MSRDPSHADTPAFQVNGEQNIIGHQAPLGEHLDCNEVDSGQDRHMGFNELSPSRVLAPFRRRIDAVRPETIADRLIGNLVTQVGQRSHDPIVSPARVLASHLGDQRLKLRRDSGPTRIAAMRRAVERAGDQPAVPRQDSGWLGRAGDLCQRLASEPFTDLGERGPLGVGQTQSDRQVCPQDPIFRSQVFILGSVPG